MQIITKNLKNTKLAQVLLKNARVILLPYLERSKSRQAYTFDDGQQVLINLPRGGIMRGGDILVDENNRFYRIEAAPEKVLKVSANNRFNLMRAAYHLGNRHVPIEVGLDYLQLEEDPVLADMLQRLGVQLQYVNAPFEPEHGAYGGGHKHGHDESFTEDYEVAQRVFESHHHHDHDGHHGHSH